MKETVEKYMITAGILIGVVLIIFFIVLHKRNIEQYQIRAEKAEQNEQKFKAERDVWLREAQLNNKQARLWKSKYDSSFAKEVAANKESQKYRKLYEDVKSNPLRFHSDGERDSILSVLYKGYKPNTSRHK